MAEISPFRGIRFRGERLDSLLSPPYDVVSPDQWESLTEADPHNILRIEHPAGSVNREPANEVYGQAAKTLQEWLSTGILTVDPTPSLYVVEHEFPLPAGVGTARRTGILTLIPARTWEEGAIKPHERTFAGPKEDRLALLRATRTQTSPIFGVWKGPAFAEMAVHGTAQDSPLQWGSFPGDFGRESVRLWRVDAAAQIRELMEDLAEARLYIADGHHRYETAVAFGREMSQTNATKSGAHVLIYLCSMDEPGLLLLPTHRVLSANSPTIKTGKELRSRLGEPWTVEETHTPVMEEPEPSPLHVFTVAIANGDFRVSRPKRDRTASRRLDVSVLHDEVLPALFLNAGPTQDGWIRYERDPNAALAAVRNGTAAVAIILSRPTVHEMIAVADAGEFMPPKSTYFYPKVPTGLVLWGVDL